MFVLGCMGSRFALAAWARQNHPLTKLLCAVIGSSFLLLWLTNSRLHAAEVCYEQIWWNALRPLHAALYIGYAVLPYHSAYQLLLVDAALGGTAWLIKRSRL
jgi:branched-subunit amino acid ABC-type transport system permease component